MADHSKIEWTDATWNPITGCTLVDEGCRHCYAAHLITSWPAIGNHPSRKGLARKNAAGESKFTGEVRFNEQWLDQPLRWKKPRKIFVCAHGDLFHPAVPDEWIDKVFAVMALAPQHTFQVLTKRPDRARDYLMGFTCDGARRLNVAYKAGNMMEDGDNAHDYVASLPWPLPNVWLGTSISDQASADLRIPQLLATPAAVRFLSAEPLLGAADQAEIELLLKNHNGLTAEIARLTAALATAREDDGNPRPIETAPKDGTMLRLLVDYEGVENWMPLTDDNQSWTIGFNDLQNIGEDEWVFVGWNWSQDCFGTGEGKVIGWLPREAIKGATT